MVNNLIKRASIQVIFANDTTLKEADNFMKDINNVLNKHKTIIYEVNLK